MESMKLQILTLLLNDIIENKACKWEVNDTNYNKINVVI